MWSFRIGRIMGIELRVHVLLLLFLALIGGIHGLHYGFVAALWSLVIMISLFSFVLLHELGHCLVAIYHKVRVRNITLWPLVGITSLDLPPDPAAEMQIAIAGPLVNLALALLLSPVAVVTYLLIHSLFFIYFVAVNVMLMLFNLVPAFPMDGGKIYRAWQTYRVGFVEATRKATRLGMFIAIIFCVLGIFDPWFFAIALFIAIAGREEAAGSEADFLEGSVPYGRFYHRDDLPLEDNEFLEQQGRWLRMKKICRKILTKRR